MYGISKSVLDRLLGLVLLLGLGPVAVILFLIYRVLLGQPLFLKLQCLGRRGKEFRLLKINTLKELYPHSLLFKCARIAGLDELPQLWNVVMGDMALIGPRPESVGTYTDHPHNSYKRLRLRPGILGLWQASGSRGNGLARSWRMEEFYAKRQSMRLDASILCRAVWRISAQLNAALGAARPDTAPLYMHHLEATEGGTLKYMKYLSEPEFQDVLLVLFQRGGRPLAYGLGSRKNVLSITCSDFLPLRVCQCLVHTLLLLGSFRPTHVHAHSTISGAICRMLQPLFGFQALYTPHCYAFTYPHALPGLRSFLRGLERYLSRVRFVGIHVSAADANLHESMDPEARTRVIPSPADRNLGKVSFSHARRSRHILVVGSDRPQKGYSLLEDIQQRLDEEGAEFCITVLGAEGRSRRVRHVGWQNVVYPFYQDAFCLLNVSINEGSSLSIIDALFCGLPVIAADMPANRELLRGRGILVADRSAQAFLSAIRLLASDHGQYLAIHSEGRKFARARHAPEGFHQSFRLIYEEAGIRCGLGKQEAVAIEAGQSPLPLLSYPRPQIERSFP